MNAPGMLAFLETPVLCQAARDTLGDLAVIRPPRFVMPTQAVQTVAEVQPSLIVVELDAAVCAGQGWLAVLRSDPASRRFPVLAIGEGDVHAACAAQMRVPLCTPGEFIAQTAALFKVHRRSFEAGDVLCAQCAEAPPPLLAQAIAEFNAGHYYDCHETLETAWVAESGPVRDLYRAILQVGVAYYHITRGNNAGARKLFLRAMQWFAHLPDECQGVDVAALRQDAAAVRAHLESRAGSDAAFDLTLLKPIRILNS